MTTTLDMTTAIDECPPIRMLPPARVGWNPRKEYDMTATRNIITPHTRDANGMLRTMARASTWNSVPRSEI